MTKRREVLRGVAGGGLASVAALAGCTTFRPGGGAGNQLPSYHRYVPAEAGGSEGTFFATLDVARLRTFEDGTLEGSLPEGAGLDAGRTAGSGDPDPLLAYPAAGVVVVAFGVSFGLLPYGFAEELAEGFSDTPIEGGATTSASGEGEAGASDAGTRVDTMVIQSSAFVLEGSFDAAALADSADGFERAGEHGGFEVYVGTEGESMFDVGGLAFGVTEDTLVALVDDDREDPRADVEGAIDVATGDGERLSEDGDAGWALRTAGHGFTSLGGWGLDPDEAAPTAGESTDDLAVESVLDRADGLVSSLAYDVEAGATVATVAAVFPEGETPSRDRLADELGTGATEREIEVDGTRVTVTARWTVEGTAGSDST